MPLTFFYSSVTYIRAKNETTESRYVQLRRGISLASIYFDPIAYHAKGLQLENFCWNGLLVRLGNQR